ncbi:MAG: hypothetical protein ABIB61_03215 [Candidatus Shapirobacteria bacterium]
MEKYLSYLGTITIGSYLIYDLVKLGKQFSKNRSIKNIFWEIIPTTIIFGIVFLVIISIVQKSIEDVVHFFARQNLSFLGLALSLGGFQLGYKYAKKRTESNPPEEKLKDAEPIFAHYTIYSLGGLMGLLLIYFLTSLFILLFSCR